MKKKLALLLSFVLLTGITACGKEKVDTTNTLTTATLTPREEMLVGSQDIMIADFEADPSYKTVELSIACYANGERQSDIANLSCAIPQNADKSHANNRGSVAVILSTDHRFTISVCGADGNVISSLASDAVQPIDAIERYPTSPITFENTKFDAGQPILLSQMAFGDPEKMQGSFTDEVFSHPEEHAEQAAVFDRIYLVKGTFR